MDSISRDTIITDYFHLGLQQSEIRALLYTKHRITISERHFKRILKKLVLSRRRNYSNTADISNFIRNEVTKSSQLHGYRWLHLKCLQSGFVVKQETVRKLLKELDPRGVEIRARRRLRRRLYYNKGPNYLWHLDGYDKLKPYGICIHGCIDGFSRHIIWLKAGTTNNNPKVIAGYFINAVEIVGGCPIRVRSDMGTENRSIEQLQIFLRNKEDSSHQSAWLYGTSQSNQRIEAWWSILRKHMAQFWMDLFQNLKDEDLFSGTFLDKSLIQFCFLRMIQAELDTVVTEWNTHRISSSKNSIAPSGRPLILYHLPQIYGAKNYLRDVNTLKLTECKEECLFDDELCDKDIFELCIIIMEEKQIQFPKEDPYSAVSLYQELRNHILGLLHT